MTRKRQDQAFVERGEEEEDERHREDECDRAGIARLFFLESELGPVVGKAARQDPGCNLFHRYERLAARIALEGIALQLGGRIEIITDHAIRPAVIPEAHDGSEWDCGAGVRTGAQALHIRNVVAERRIRLRRDAIGASEEIEIIDIARSEIGAERLEHALDRHSEPFRTLSIDIGIKPGRLGVEGGEDSSQPRRPVRLGDHADRDLLERLVAGAGAILDQHLVSTACTDAAH